VSLIHSHHFSTILPTTPAMTQATPSELLDLLRRSVQAVGLTAVGELAVAFQPQGISVVLLLAESHVALHLWPEQQQVTVDIHICDYAQNNRPKAENLADLLTVALAGQGDRTQWQYWRVTA
jgi:S-adenosylmethionine decarboxylase